jgi:transposase
MNALSEIQAKFSLLSGHLNERSRRIWAATEARALGYGGVTLVSKATGISRMTISSGLAEICSGSSVPLQRIRKTGGGRKSCVQHMPSFPERLEALVEPLTRGDPESPLRWTCKSTRRLTQELAEQGIGVGRQTVTKQLHVLGYSLQANRKTEEGKDHPDRNAQFEHINRRAKGEMRRCNPVISVDTKKKELVGNYKNGGQKWQRKGQALKVQGHDFPDPDVPRAFPYGVYDLSRNEGFVNVGSDHDTSQFAVASIRAWWNAVGRESYPHARRIQIMADSGGSNGYRRTLWKWELQRLADETGLPVRVCHFPPGASKWNKVEHRLFSFISQNWRGEPLISYETIVKLIASTTTRTGLKVHCQLDTNQYPLKKKISAREMKSIGLLPDKFHGEWNYEIKPKIEARL